MLPTSRGPRTNRLFSKSIKQYFLTGLFVIIPLGLTLLVVGWLVNYLDKLLGGFFDRLLGFHMPGLGIVLAAIIIVFIGALLSTNILAQKIFEGVELSFLHIPGVRAVYRTIKALTDTFSPENQKSFRGVALVEYPHPGSLSIGFITNRVALDGLGEATERHVSVYVPTNHLYIGNTVLVPESKVYVTSLSVQEAIQIVLSSGAGMPSRLGSRKEPVL
jgi:uncharacterized membrane protein